jgi:hypothetical protein
VASKDGLSGGCFSTTAIYFQSRFFAPVYEFPEMQSFKSRLNTKPFMGNIYVACILSNCI